MAVADYTLNFLNGSSTGSVTLPVGTYRFVSTTIPGYVDGSVAEFTITPTTTSVALSITATGTLQVTVEDDLDDPVVTGSLQLSNQSGETKYGTLHTIEDGSVTFSNVPHTTDGINFYMNQDASDENHDPIAAPQAVSMKAVAQNETVTNARKTVAPTFQMTDANYAQITPLTGTLVVKG